MADEYVLLVFSGMVMSRLEFHLVMLGFCDNLGWRRKELKRPIVWLAFLDGVWSIKLENCRRLDSLDVVFETCWLLSDGGITGAEPLAAAVSSTRSSSESMMLSSFRFKKVLKWN